MKYYKVYCRVVASVKHHDYVLFLKLFVCVPN